MRAVKKMLAALLAAAVAVSLAGCREAGISASPAGGEDFQKNMHQSKFYFIDDMCETGDGVYLEYKGFLYYLDKGAKRVTVLCSRPDCPHDGSDCGAWVNARGAWLSGGRLYCVTFGKGTDGGRFVTSLGGDGAGRENVQELLYSWGGTQSTYDNAIYHRGYVYYVNNDVLYRTALGGGGSEAIWGEDPGTSGQGTVSWTGNELRFRLWADGDYVYFMVNLRQEDGAYKDVLFAYGTAEKTAQQVWLTPDRRDVGDWDTAGVSVSSWYVTDGYIYYYLAGNGFWRCALGSGENERLVDISDEIEHGTAIFSEKYMCLLNDAPGGDVENVGGDRFRIYGLDGALITELTLEGLIRDAEGVTGFAPLFMTGDEVYFVADADVRGQVVNGMRYDEQRDILCCADIGSGEITQVYDWE